MQGHSGGGDGAEIIYSLRNSDKLSRTIANEFIKSGQNVRKYYQRRLPSNSSKDYYYILRETPNNESIIVEYGFADSKGDDVSQLKNNWEELTEAVVRGLASYLGVTYTPPKGSNIEYYIVKKGDTLYGIASKFGVSVDDIKKANNLTSNTLTIGTSLKIPNKNINDSNTNIDTTNTYVVKKGDSLYSIATSNGMTVNELKSLNNLTSNIISIGQVLKIYKDTPITEAVHIVGSGDTLYSIAKKYNVSVDALKAINNKTNNLLSIGEKLKIPNSNTNNANKTYIVKPGDTLYGIASKNNTTVNAIKSLNNLNNNILSIGMSLIIPN